MRKYLKHGLIILGIAIVLAALLLWWLSRPDVATLSEEAVTGRVPELSTSGGTSDAQFIKDHCPVVEFGLVGKTMHMANERVALSDLETLTDIYDVFLARWFAAHA